MKEQVKKDVEKLLEKHSPSEVLDALHFVLESWTLGLEDKSAIVNLKTAKGKIRDAGRKFKEYFDGKGSFKKD